MFSSRSARILLTQFNTCKRLIGEANYAHNARKLRRNKTDPGIAARKTLVPDKEEFKELEDHDYDFEADFISVGSAYNQNLNDESLHREKLKYQIVQQRYFKETLPNFLSWSDKEQIRHLHKTNPEEWTIERLAEGFPALPHVVSVSNISKLSSIKTIKIWFAENNKRDMDENSTSEKNQSRQICGRKLEIVQRREDEGSATGRSGTFTKIFSEEVNFNRCRFFCCA